MTPSCPGRLRAEGAEGGPCRQRRSEEKNEENTAVRRWTYLDLVKCLQKVQLKVRSDNAFAKDFGVRSFAC